MKGLLDLVAILSGVFGLAAMMIGGPPLTPESAPLYTARSAIIIAFVVIPFFMARAVEKFRGQGDVNEFHSMPVRKPRHVQELQTLESNAAETTYFDYFFKPGSAREWVTTPRNTSSMRNANDGSDPSGQK